jgi:hypothetical protein
MFLGRIAFAQGNLFDPSPSANFVGFDEENQPE